MHFETRENLNKVKYPNLLAEHFAGMCLDALARGANVSRAIMGDVLIGTEDLTQYEKERLARYLFANKEYLFSPKLSVLSNKNNRHKKWIAELNKALDEIWEYEKKGNSKAHDFMNGFQRIELVNLVLWFNMNDEYYNQFVTYAAYRRVNQYVRFCFTDIANELHRPRTKRQSASA